ncbi:amidase [Actinoallomurus iriomotensis]|uniref:Amidohydrolase n=1 Tax=Actinoallomurus iriomotensis TaxID=478107 RepID=A0A9W6W427_9ACTN|nr:amidase [Actinoallomurus iriomotensis]GLY89512.1 amidohydrolase [Actinoallomurus iriomotensis]
MSRLPSPAGAGYFARHTVTGLTGELRAGRVSPEDLVEQALAAAARLEPELNAFVTLDETGARVAARRATEELAAGVDRGPLHGIPVAVKDVVDTAGLRTTMGSRHFADRVPDRDATCVRRLRAAGAVIIGKTATHEFAYGPTGDRAAGGATRNPYRPERMAGGSSSGSAAAVAAGVVPVSVGTDTGGSVRIPAALCGVVGLKPSHGAVPVDGVYPVAPSLDTVGPLARTAADCRLLWNVLAGRTAAERDDAPPMVRRVGWIPPDTIHPTSPRVAEAARACLAGGGIAVEEVAVPEAAALARAYHTIQGSEVYAVHADRMATAADLYDEEVAERLRGAARVRGWEYVRACDLRDRAREAVAALLRVHDLLALPTVPIPAPPLDARARAGDAGADVRTALLALTSPWSVLGLPAVTLPAGLVDGLPAGLQLMAPVGGEELLLAVAQELHDATTETESPVPARH